MSNPQRIWYVDNISEDDEKIPVSLIDAVSKRNQPLLPNFTYISHRIYPKEYTQKLPKGCRCEESCIDSDVCLCVAKNESVPYDSNGCLLDTRPLVYECGPNCACPASCYTRVSQGGIKFPLQVFKTVSCGWGVRTLAPIPIGSFVCEFIGQILTHEQANNVEVNNVQAGEQAKKEEAGCDDYLFNIGIGNGGSSTALGANSSHVPAAESYTIDAKKYGNVGRFLNHSCSPNLVAINVLYDHHDIRMPHIMFFAAAQIPPLTELTYNTRCTIDGVVDSDGNVRKKICLCGSPDCTGRIY